MRVYLLTTMRQGAEDPDCDEDIRDVWFEDLTVHATRPAAAAEILMRMLGVYAAQSARIEEWVAGPPYPSSLPFIDVIRQVVLRDGTRPDVADDMEFLRTYQPESSHIVFYRDHSARKEEPVLYAGGRRGPVRASVRVLELAGAELLSPEEREVVLRCIRAAGAYECKKSEHEALMTGLVLRWEGGP